MNAAERNSVVVREKSLGFISGERREAACRRGSERVERESCRELRRGLGGWRRGEWCQPLMKI